MPIDREEFEGWMQTLRGDIRGVHDRLDALNGRTRTNEQDIAVLQERVPGGSGRAAAWGGGIGGLVIGLVEGLKYLVGK